MKVEAAKDPHARPGNANARKENNAETNYHREKRKSSQSPERIIARLKRDAATDTHAAALLGSIEAPSLALLRPLVPSARPTPHDGIAQDSGAS